MQEASVTPRAVERGPGPHRGRQDVDDPGQERCRDI